MLATPGSAYQAAIRAGFAPKSAHVTASRLLRDPIVQHELAKHFLDEEQVVSDSLSAALARLQYLVEQGSDEKFMKATKLLLEYTRLAVPVLGLEVKKSQPQPADIAVVNPEALIAQHEDEIARLKELLASRSPVS